MKGKFTVETALAQIKEKRYVENLVERGIPKEHIHCYAFAFEGKTVLIESAADHPQITEN